MDRTRQSGKWMNIVDDRILEYLANEDEVASPAEIKRGAGLPWSGTHVARRCRKLDEMGFLTKVSGAGVYSISERGRDYLAGEFDARTLDDEQGNTTAAAD